MFGNGNIAVFVVDEFSFGVGLSGDRVGVYFILRGFILVFVVFGIENLNFGR